MLSLKGGLNLLFLRATVSNVCPTRFKYQLNYSAGIFFVGSHHEGKYYEVQFVAMTCEKRKGPLFLGLQKRFQGRALASNSFQCWHFSCLRNCWTFAISQLVPARRKDSGRDVRWLEKRKAPVALRL